MWLGLNGREFTPDDAPTVEVNIYQGDMQVGLRTPRSLCLLFG